MKSTLIAAALLAAVAGAQAQNVTIVNGKPVPVARVETMIQQITKNGQPRSPEIEKQVKDEVVHREILMQEAQRRGIAASKDFQNQLELARQAILIRELQASFLKQNPILDSDAQKEYEAVKAQQGGQEYKARHILVETEEEVEPLAVAKILKAIADEEAPGLVILGKQSISDDSNQTGQMLAALMGRPQGTFANTVEVEGDSVTVKREVDGGLQTVKLTMPAIVTTDLRLNEPRYASLPNIMKAKQKPLATKTAADYGVDLTPRLKTLKVAEPPVRQAGEKVADVAALVEKVKALGIA